MNKQPEPSADAPKFVPSSGQIQSPSDVAARSDSPARRIVWQLVGLLGASIILGFAFNASSPVGVRFNETDSETLYTTTVTDRLSAPPAATVADRLVVLPPSPPAPVEKPAVKLASVTEPIPPSVRPPAPTPAPQHPIPPSVAPAQLPATPVAATSTPPAEPNPAPIHWAQAKPLVAAGQAVLVDVRHKSLFDAGHIPGAFSLPEASSPEEFNAFLNQYPANLTLIVYCSSVSCSQSARVAGRLATQYHRPAVKFMTGGYLEYQQAELAKNPAPPTP